MNVQHIKTDVNHDQMIWLFIWQKATLSVSRLLMKLELVTHDVFSEWKAVVLEVFTQSGMIPLWSLVSPSAQRGRAFHRRVTLRRDVWRAISAGRCRFWSVRSDEMMTSCVHDGCAGSEVILLLIESSLLQSLGLREPNMDIVLLLFIIQLAVLLNEQFTVHSLISCARSQSQETHPDGVSKKLSQIYGPIKMQSTMKWWTLFYQLVGLEQTWSKTNYRTKY